MAKKKASKKVKVEQELVAVDKLHVIPTELLQSVIILLEDLPAKASRGMLNAFEIAQSKSHVISLSDYMAKLPAEDKED